MNVTPASRWLHRFAWFTATLTLLLPVATGAVVTTLDAGMAFRDWPSSDGYNMLAYPWLRAARNQFVEHGHRLSGLAIGVLSIALAVWTWCVETRRVPRMLAVAIFGSVLAQGLLGGLRVRMDEKVMAFLHGDFGAAVFSLMCVFVLVTGPQWESRQRVRDASRGKLARMLTFVVMLSVAIQYFIGGVLRHLVPYGLAGNFSWVGLAHPWFALVPVVLTPVLVTAALRSGSDLLIRGATIMATLVVSQGLLGLASWSLRYGVPDWSVVAQPGSPAQVVVCSLHKVVGMLTLMTSVLNVVCACSIQSPVTDRVSADAPGFDGSIVGVAT